ncbi:unnamed protein product [Moneuplotes crassus]|uniref:Uncharacterized protein n=1 Tax=Euplotes crassus TaxID=5936 RepID=A0AAD1YAB2_EUPCR|nr:unnamed protein product [Moneuplotes crassus]
MTDKEMSFSLFEDPAHDSTPSYKESEYENINVFEDFSQDPICSLNFREMKNIPQCLVTTFEIFVTSLNSFQLRLNKFKKEQDIINQKMKKTIISQAKLSQKANERTSEKFGETKLKIDEATFKTRVDILDILKSKFEKIDLAMTDLYSKSHNCDDLILKSKDFVVKADLDPTITRLTDIAESALTKASGLSQTSKSLDLLKEDLKGFKAYYETQSEQLSSKIYNMASQISAAQAAQAARAAEAKHEAGLADRELACRVESVLKSKLEPFQNSIQTLTNQMAEIQQKSQKDSNLHQWKDQMEARIQELADRATAEKSIQYNQENLEEGFGKDFESLDKEINQLETEVEKATKVLPLKKRKTSFKKKSIKLQAIKNEFTNKFKIHHATIEDKINTKIESIEARISKLENPLPLKNLHKEHKEFILTKPTDSPKAKVRFEDDIQKPQTQLNLEPHRTSQNPKSPYSKPSERSFWTNSSYKSKRNEAREPRKLEAIKVNVRRRPSGRNSIELGAGLRALESIEVKYEPIQAFPENHKYKNMHASFLSPKYAASMGDKLNSGFS